jgi:hypothetical protein
MSALRSLILAAADSSRLQRFVQRYGFRLGAARFVAGESLDDAVPVLRRLNESGLLTNTTLLGEGVRDEAETRAVVAAYREVLDRLKTEGLRTNVAVKLSAAPTLSQRPFPFDDLWPSLHAIVNAYGPERVMWGSDWTRALPVVSYRDQVRFITGTNELSAADKELIMGQSLRRQLRWPREKAHPA